MLGLSFWILGYAVAQLPPTPGFDIDFEAHRSNLMAEHTIVADATPTIQPGSVCVPIPDKADPSRTARIVVTQFEAAKDAHTHHNRILKMVTQYFNAHFTDIVRVNIEYEGEALSGKIGQYEIITHFSRNVASGVVNECRTIEYWVEDINECDLGIHKCHTSTRCVNTIGSYECECAYSDFFGVENRFFKKIYSIFFNS